MRHHNNAACAKFKRFNRHHNPLSQSLSHFTLSALIAFIPCKAYDVQQSRTLGLLVRFPSLSNWQAL
jgi:hypothetical protein